MLVIYIIKTVYTLGRLVVLDWDQSFSMQAYSTSPGSQRVVLRGYVTEQRADGLYAAPLLPQLFYGADGSQLSAWSQYLGSTGEQTILSRSGGQPSIPKEELFWRKVRGPETIKQTAVQPTTTKLEISPMLIPIIAIIGGIALVLWSRK